MHRRQLLATSAAALAGVALGGGRALAKTALPLHLSEMEPRPGWTWVLLSTRPTGRQRRDLRPYVVAQVRHATDTGCPALAVLEGDLQAVGAILEVT